MIPAIKTAKCRFESMKGWETCVAIDECGSYSFDSWTKFPHWETSDILNFHVNLTQGDIFISIQFYYMLDSNK